jgi:predicted nuclease of restriction endonuclease-like RecB superfamily
MAAQFYCVTMLNMATLAPEVQRWYTIEQILVSDIECFVPDEAISMLDREILVSTVQFW